MILEIRKAGFTNKGAEMMLLSIISELRRKYPNCQLVMAPTTDKGSQPFSKLTSLGMKTKFKLRRGKIDLSFIGNFIPYKIRNAYGIVIDKEIDVVLDASGFSYSDQWGTYDCMELNDSVKIAVKNNQKYILLPQAFGPFDIDENKKRIKSVLNNVDLTFARDRVSLAYLEKINSKGNIIQKPDFTCSLNPIIDDEIKRFSGMVPIVPNYRMLDKTDKDTSVSYLNTMIGLVKIAISKGFKPYFLIHEIDLDKEVAEKINASLGSKFEIIEESNPKRIKGYLGVAKFIIASRYHASISGLSQNIPVIGTSWSHKYEELFSEYNFSKGLVNNINNTEVESLINEMSVNAEYLRITENLTYHSMLVKESTKDMWLQVFKIIDET